MRPNLHVLRRMRGLTLMELMVTLSIAVVLLALATPSFVALIERNRATTAANDLQRGLMTARAHAIATGERVVLAPMVADGDWHDGWQVFVDVNNNATLDGAPEERVQAFAALPPNITLSPNANYGDAGKRYISFNALGYPRTTAGAFPGNGTFVIGSGAAQRAVCLDLTGRSWIKQGGAC